MSNTRLDALHSKLIQLRQKQFELPRSESREVDEEIAYTLALIDRLCSSGYF